MLLVVPLALKTVRHVPEDGGELDAELEDIALAECAVGIFCPCAVISLWHEIVVGKN